MIPFKVHPLPTYRIGAVSDGGTHKGKKAKKSMFRCKMFDKTRTSIFDLICMSSETSVRSLSDSSRLIVLRMIAAFVVRRFADFSSFSSLETTSFRSTKNVTPLVGVDDVEFVSYMDCVILSF